MPDDDDTAHDQSSDEEAATTGGLPADAPDPATLAEADERTPPAGGPAGTGISDPSDPIGRREDATGRGA